VENLLTTDGLSAAMAATKRLETLTQRCRGRREPQRKLNSAKLCVLRASALEKLRKKTKFSQIVVQMNTDGKKDFRNANKFTNQ
jgi:hypothetical protein